MRAKVKHAGGHLEEKRVYKTNQISSKTTFYTESVAFSFAVRHSSNNVICLGVFPLTYRTRRTWTTKTRTKRTNNKQKKQKNHRRPILSKLASGVPANLNSYEKKMDLLFKLLNSQASDV